MDDLVKLYIDYRIKKNLPELSREEIFALVDFNTWQGKHAAQPLRAVDGGDADELEGDGE